MHFCLCYAVLLLFATAPLRLQTEDTIISDKNKTGQTEITQANIQIKNVVSKQIDHAVENGNGLKVIINNGHADLSFKQIKFPHPEMEEILQCLVSDSNVRNYLSFEDWASDFGYDEDSRKAEKIYVESQKITSSFAKLVGGVDKITMLEELLQEIENEDTPKPKKMKM